VPSLPALDGTDSHLWLGWHRGTVDDLAERARLIPRQVRFVSEFGAQSVPDSAMAFAEPERWPDLDWDGLREHHGLEVDVMLAHFPPADFPTFSAWRVATQRFQATLLREHIETLRRLKYRPTGGFCFSWLADPAPMISASVLDHERTPKPAWDAVVDACRPVIVVMDTLGPALVAGSALDLDVHVVNDLRQPITDGTVSVTCTWRGGRRQWAFRGDVGADACELVGRLRFTVPDEPGDLLVGLALHGRDPDGREVRATRRAGARILAR
jgi:beta-mannosidase